ncbi:MAG: hypothetical protein HY966_07565, partial [Ignavibacteriales bacterium]|nr:hypothetical protein [Ignavibacteriales bacterium]
LGQEIATLYEGTKSAGYVDLVWNGRDSYGRPVASGVYLYRIDARAGDGSKAFVQSRKMMMLK